MLASAAACGQLARQLSLSWPRRPRNARTLASFALAKTRCCNPSVSQHASYQHQSVLPMLTTVAMYGSLLGLEMCLLSFVESCRCLVSTAFVRPPYALTLRSARRAARSAPETRQQRVTSRLSLTSAATPFAVEGQRQPGDTDATRADERGAAPESYDKQR